MGYRPSEGPVLRALCVHMDPLMVVSRVGEVIDPGLIDVDPCAGTEFLPDERSQLVKCLNFCRHWISSFIAVNGSEVLFAIFR